MRGLSLVVASGGHSSSRCAGLSLSRPLLLRSTGSSSAACRDLPRPGARTCIPCIGRRILNHCATREAPRLWFLTGYIRVCPRPQHPPCRRGRRRRSIDGRFGWARPGTRSQQHRHTRRKGLWSVVFLGVLEAEDVGWLPSWLYLPSWARRLAESWEGWK